MHVLNYKLQRHVSYQNCYSTYSCFSTDSLPEFVKVDEELLDTDSILGYEGLDPSLDISLHSEFTRGLVVALMSVLGQVHVLDLVANG